MHIHISLQCCRSLLSDLFLLLRENVTAEETFQTGLVDR